MPRGAIVIHGHFYQPPREDPWLGVIERQTSAFPHHDWNQRITAECYRPNTISRVLNQHSRIEALVNNFEYLSFNIGPTLMSFIRSYHREVYDRIIEADALSSQRLGHGNAIAQVYNHVIMPLASEADKETQIYWGIEDFRFHFNRDPESMWLSETAVDYPTLTLLHKFGIKYLILSPHQAHRIRGLDAELWEDVSAGTIDSSVPYRVFLKNASGEKLPGKHIDVFFYDRFLSQAIAFEGLLKSADTFSGRVQQTAAGLASRNLDYVISLVTDGESYGHHEKFGDMCLSSFFHRKVKNLGLEVTNFSAYLGQHPPRSEAELKTVSAWSCAHGVGRWQDDCGCSAGGSPGWNQKWRKPLRQAFDLLSEKTVDVFQKEGRKLFQKPDQARNHYIEVLLSPDYRDKFLKYEMRPEPYRDSKKRQQALALLEMQKFAMMTYTSCAWFFSDISGIEPVQNLKYACRLLEYLGEFTPLDPAGPGASPVKKDFLAILAKAKSNYPELGTGRMIFEKQIIASVITPGQRVAIRILQAAITEETEGQDETCYDDLISFRRYAEAKENGFQLLLYEGSITERPTGVLRRFTIMCHNRFGSYQPEGYVWMGEALTRAAIDTNLNLLRRGKQTIAETIDTLCRLAPPEYYPINRLPYHDKCELFSTMIKSMNDNLGGVFRQIYDDHREMLTFCRHENLLLPEVLKTPVALTLSFRLTEELTAGLRKLNDRTLERIIGTMAELRELKLDLAIPEIGRMVHDLVSAGLNDYEKTMNPDTAVRLRKLLTDHNIYQIHEYSRLQELAFTILTDRVAPLLEKETAARKLAASVAAGIASFLTVAEYLNIDTGPARQKLAAVSKAVPAGAADWPLNFPE